MKWFAVRMVYSITTGEGNHHPQFDHQCRLFRALSASDAFGLAERYGKESEQRYQNTSKEWVIWEFKGITGISELQFGASGEEICSGITEIETSGLTSYLHWLEEQTRQTRVQFLSLSPLTC